MYNVSSLYTSCMEDLYAYTWFGTFKNHAVDLLIRTSFIERCICGIFWTEQKVLLIQSRALPMFTSLPKVVSLLERDVGDDPYAKDSGNIKVLECHVARLITVQPYTKCLLTVTSPTDGL